MTRKIAPAALIALGCLAAPASAAAETVVAALQRPTQISSWRGIGAFSLYDAPSGSYRLAITRSGGAPQLPAVAPRPVPFDVDVGPDGDGSAALVYSRCRREAPARRDCDLYRYSPARGVETKLAGTDSDGASEFNPTIWRGRVAWVRTDDRRAGAAPYVYSRALTAPRGRRSQRLPGIPARRAGGPTTDRAIEGLELHGRRLALNVTYNYPGVGGICAFKEIRLDTLDGSSRSLADQLCGLGGQSYVGLSFDRGNLYWARYCAGDPGGCRPSDSGAYRYTLRTRRYALAGFVRMLAGFSYAGGGRAYEVRADCVDTLEEPALPVAPCQVVHTDPLSFSPRRPPRR